MASVIKQNRKLGITYSVRLTESESPTGKRVKITCTGMTKKQAAHVCMHVENIISANQSGTSLANATASWLGELDGPIRNKLEELGLIEPAKKNADAETSVVKYMTDFVDQRTDIEESTRQIYRRALHFASEFFKEVRMNEVNVGMAKDYDIWLRQAGRKNATEGLGENTARKMLDKLKTVFNSAVDHGHLSSSPFRKIATSIQRNEAKQQFVEAATILKVMKFAQDAEFKAIMALARFGGLRTPSEFRHLKHGDFNLKAKSFVIYSQKTANKGKATRECPIFPDLWPYLEELVSTDPKMADEYIFSEKYRACSDANIFNTMERAIKKAGVDVWPDLWRNLRASRQSELFEMKCSMRDVCDWLGNSPEVAMRHYLRKDPASQEIALSLPVHQDPKPIEKDGATNDDIETADLFADLTVPEHSESDGTERTRPKKRRPKTQVIPLAKPQSTKKATQRKSGLMLPQGLEP